MNILVYDGNPYSWKDGLSIEPGTRLLAFLEMNTVECNTAIRWKKNCVGEVWVS